MAAAARFDTLDYARKLEAAGVPRTQAEVQAHALNEAISESLATREDFANLETRMDARFDSLRHELGGKIETLKWMFGALVAINAATFVQLFLRH